MHFHYVIIDNISVYLIIVRLYVYIKNSEVNKVDRIIRSPIRLLLKLLYKLNIINEKNKINYNYIIYN